MEESYPGAGHVTVEDWAKCKWFRFIKGPDGQVERRGV